ncbi:hypothetical protein [Rhizobium grahamii]|uniref:Uncharacterized protein n=1 Tax=Rhizobium grahamii TaxID=1120045 RepID=A0A370KTP9_9HYPH|nr:hypothetical protein [Rhizobium grahamii]RDJ14345.1 hypothetical protein B5K06_05440 [Rhizobium grahamii]
MVSRLPLSLVFATAALPTLGDVAIDPTTVTCKDYNAASHDGMVEIGSTVRQALKDDPKLGKLSEAICSWQSITPARPTKTQS